MFLGNNYLEKLKFSLALGDHMNISDTTISDFDEVMLHYNGVTVFRFQITIKFEFRDKQLRKSCRGILCQFLAVFSHCILDHLLDMMWRNWTERDWIKTRKLPKVSSGSQRKNQQQMWER